MDLPRNARVIIVDDKYDEVKDLVQVLAKQGVSTLYYSGDNTQYPIHPLSGVRLLFLDLVLKGMSGTQPKDVASKVVNTYRSLIADTNGPLIIVLWTKNIDYCKHVKENLRRIVKNPYFVLAIDKMDCCVAGKRNEYSIPKIRKAITDGLKAVDKTMLKDIVGMNIAFENALFSSANALLDRFAKIAPMGRSWAKMMSFVYAKLYASNGGETGRNDVGRQFAIASRLYSEGLSDFVYDFLIDSKLEVSKGFCFSDKLIPDGKARKLIGRINAFLNCSGNSSGEIAPGCLFEVESSVKMTELKNAILKDFVEKGTRHKALMRSTCTKMCRLVVTPSCDYSLGKELDLAKSGRTPRKLNRVVYGLLVPKSLFSTWGKKPFKDGPKVYQQLKDIEFRGERYALLIHVGTLSLELLDANEEMHRYLFTLKALPLSDIQTNVSNQMNRIGVCTVG